MRFKLWPLLAVGGVLACHAPAGSVVTTGVSSGELTRFSDFSLTGASSRRVTRFTFQPHMFLRANYQLDEYLSPYAGLGPNGPSILGSSVAGVGVDGQTLAGQDVVGSVFETVTQDGAASRLRIDGLTRGEGVNRDLLYYTVAMRQEGGGWEPLCADAAPAIALPGAWDLSSGQPGQGGWQDVEGFFFACSGSTVAKCYELGFKPWKVVHGEDGKVSSLHEACVRALRADYEGTGESHTRAGVDLVLATSIDDALAEDYQLEALWGIGGAQCRVVPREAEQTASLARLEKCRGSHFRDESTLLYSFVRPEKVDIYADVNEIRQNRKKKTTREHLDNTKKNAIWLAGPVTYRDDEPVISRVVWSTGDSVDYRLDEMDPNDGSHPSELVAVGGFERSVHRLGELRAEGRIFRVSSTVRRIYFRQHFETPPVVFASLRGEGTEVPVTIRVFDVNEYGFSIRLEEPESEDGIHESERVHMLAVEPGETVVEGRNVWVTRVEANHGWTTLKTDQFRRMPRVFATVQTRRGTDPVTIRFTQDYANHREVKLRLQEERSRDRETEHKMESLGVMLIDHAGVVRGIDRQVSASQ
ncbi:MAG: ADYC domain-containing protein [Myxococcota bacterium]